MEMVGAVQICKKTLPGILSAYFVFFSFLHDKVVHDISFYIVSLHKHLVNIPEVQSVCFCV